MKHKRRHFTALLALLGLPLAAVGEMRIAGGTAQAYFGNSPEARLARAAAEGRTDDVMRLVKAGADVNAHGRQNMTPLVWALTARNVEGLRGLLQAGADPDQHVGPHHSFHPVWLAAGMDSPEPLRVLLEFKGDPNAAHEGPEFNALMQSIMRPDNLKLLVRAGADVNAADRMGRTVALSAAKLAQYEVVTYLLKQGYRRNLPELASEVSNRPVPSGFEHRRQMTLSVLRALGAAPPVGKAPRQQAQ